VLLVHAVASTASAGLDDEMNLNLLPPSIGTGGLVVAEYVGCLGGQVVEFTLAGAEQEISCVGSDGGESRGASRAVFVAPRTAGGYLVTGQIVGNSGSLQEANLTVFSAGALPPDDLAETGPASGPAVPMAAIAVAVGLGLLGAARFRRRPTVS
jgi:hypothetical protein